MAISSEKYKEMSIKEFTKAASKYESDHAGVYELCKKDYPAVLQELEKEAFMDLLDAGCGPGPMLSVLAEKYPDKNYTGIDLTPAMIEQAKRKHLANTTFLVGDCEHLPFKEESFDVILCLNSFHHYPGPQDFFDSVKRCLKPGGRLILRDLSTDNPLLIWFIDHIELPVCRLFGHGDVKLTTRKAILQYARTCGLDVETCELRKGMRLHCVIRKQGR
jgi:ubiquinone/menaquinone biosynthesis C-methylase UbiE